MGSSDMALPAGYEGTNAPGEYTYDDMPSGQTDPSLSHFSISHDTAYIIPVLQQALQLNPNLKIMATPWTAPAWMKSNDSLQQGSLNASDFQVYAQYFVDFIKAYEADGLPIYAVTPQNEPENDNVMPTMPMSASDETTFIANDLGPALAQSGLASTKILGYDHNWDDPSYPTTILSNATASSYTPGIAWHCYAGSASAMTTFHNSYPSKDTYQTECSGGTWQGAIWPNGFQDTMELAINDARNWSKTVVLWNMALDPNGNPNLGTANSCTTCRGVVTINQSNGSVTYNSDYYGLGHFSKFVLPGAYYVSSNSFGSGNIEDAAFKNPDGSDVLVVYNGNSSSSNTFQVVWNNQAFSYTLPAGAAATFKWSGTGSSTPTPTPTPTHTPTPTPTATTPGSGTYYIKNAHSGLVVDDTNGSTSNGTLIQQWAESSGDTNQEWTLVSAGGGYYYIQNVHSGLVLDDTNGSTSNGTQVQQWAEGSGNANQEWSLQSAGGGYYYIVNLHSGLALDDTNGSTSNGTILQLWALTSGDANQEWSFTTV
jgi:glucosylceramidase